MVRLAPPSFRVEQEASFLCPLTSDGKSMQAAKQTNILVKGRELNFSRVFTNYDGLFTVEYANCQANTQVSFDLSVTAENPNHNQLSAGDAPLPICFFLSSCLFFLALLVWGAVLWVYRDNVQPIQCFMAMTCLVKIVFTVLQAMRYTRFQVTGRSSGWSTATHVFMFLKGLLFFSVILLLGSGWSYLKPFLSSRDKKILFLILLLQVVVNTAVVMVEELPSSQSGWETWRDVLQLADIMCCFGVLMSIVWSIRQLNEVGEADGKTQDNVKKLKLFRRFYMIVLGYIYLTRIFVVMMGTLLACRYTWVCTVVEEFATLCLFVWIGHAFRPTHNNPYLQIPSETEMQSNNNA